MLIILIRLRLLVVEVFIISEFLARMITMATNRLIYLISIIVENETGFYKIENRSGI